jgi:spermidine synthase
MPAPSPTTTGTRFAVHALVGIGGVAALSWEVLWQLQASLALGVSARGTAITLAAMMAGMTLGALSAARLLRTRSVARPVRLYGMLELAIGLCGLLMLSGFRWLERIDSALYGLFPGSTPVVHALGIALLLGPPAIAMGATVPVFARIAERHGTSVAGLYGINTVGASAGALLIAFLLLPALGVSETRSLIAAANFGVFLGTRSLERRTPRAVPAAGAAAAQEGSRYSLVTAGVVVCGTGFATFGLEVAWFRSLRAAFYSSTESFAIILAAVLIPLGVGARLVPRIRRRGVVPSRLLALAGVAILLATPLVERMDLFVPANLLGAYATILLKRLLFSLAILGPPILLLGMVLPWLLEEFGDPVRCGWLYGINTIGAVLGSLGAAWLLLPTIGFARSAWLLGGLVVVLAAAMHRGRGIPVVAAAGAAALVVAATQTSSVGRERVQGIGSAGKLMKILAHDEGPDSTASVVEDRNGDRALMIDGFVTAAEGRDPAGSMEFAAGYMEWMGRLPMLLHPDPRTALVLCFGTGQTANAVREEGPRAIDVVELNPVVFEMAEHFESNRGVLADPRVRPIVMDARAWLRRSDRRYDVVTLEPMAPYFAGVNSLYSKEFYEIVAKKLAPGGIVAQWVPFHLLPPAYAASVVATFRSVFPDAILWRLGTGIILGRVEPSSGALGSDWPGLDRVGGTRSLSPEKIVKRAVLDPEAVARYARLGSLITDDNQLLAYGRIHRQIRRYGGARARVNRRLVTQIAGGGAPEEIPGP